MEKPVEKPVENSVYLWILVPVSYVLDKSVDGRLRGQYDHIFTMIRSNIVKAIESNTMFF